MYISTVIGLFNTQQVIDPKCRTLTMCSSERLPIRGGGLSSNDCAAKESRVSGRAKVPQPAVSKHLGVLKQAGLVRDRHEGRQTHYSAQLRALAPLIDWTSQMAGFWQSRFDQLEDLLKRMDQ